MLSKIDCVEAVSNLQVHTTIESQFTFKKITGISPSQEEIRRWMKMLIFIRRQCELTGKEQANYQLVAMLVTIYFSSTCLFVTANFLTESTFQRTTFGVSQVAAIASIWIYPIISMARMTIRILMASAVNDEVILGIVGINIESGVLL
jgi:hypothetical protein